LSVIVDGFECEKAREMRFFLTRIDAVKIVQVRRETQALDRSFDVRLDVFGRVGDSSVFETGETAFGCDYTSNC
jgi:hypothetical protein